MRRRMFSLKVVPLIGGRSDVQRIVRFRLEHVPHSSERAGTRFEGDRGARAARPP
jgi:hypothetical protein